jgi:hypothetical protein
MGFTGSEKDSKNIFWAGLVLFLVGMHSILLGVFIYFFTDSFYSTFFATSVENIFFVRQSGTFLFLAGLFYLFPLLHLRNFYNLILLVIVSKIVAVVFLLSNATYTPAPIMIYLAAFFDALMGAVLIAVYFRCWKVYARRNRAVVPRDNAGLKESA